MTPCAASGYGCPCKLDTPRALEPGNDLRVIRFAVDDLKRMVAAHGPVLVHCHAGRSRSAVVVAAYLMDAHALGANTAVDRVAAKRPINITPALLTLLRKLET